MKFYFVQKQKTKPLNLDEKILLMKGTLIDISNFVKTNSLDNCSLEECAEKLGDLHKNFFQPYFILKNFHNKDSQFIEIKNYFESALEYYKILVPYSSNLIFTPLNNGSSFDFV